MDCAFAMAVSKLGTGACAQTAMRGHVASSMTVSEQALMLLIARFSIVLIGSTACNEG
jgi:hypothetical protein